MFSTAIALKKDTIELKKDFSEVTTPIGKEEDRIIYGKQITSCSAIIKNTTIKISLASLHCWGFSLFNPSLPQNKPEETEEQKESKLNALDYFTKARNIMNKQTDSDIWIVAGDTNHNEENYSDTFNTMKKAGYTIFSPNEPTNINAHELEYPLRTIDQIMIKQNSISIWTRIKHLATDFFVSKMTTEITSSNVKILENFDFTVDGNCSDHKPVMMTLDFKQTQSQPHITRLWNWVMQSLRRNG